MNKCEVNTGIVTKVIGFLILSSSVVACGGSNYNTQQKDYASTWIGIGSGYRYTIDTSQYNLKTAQEYALEIGTVKVAAAHRPVGGRIAERAGLATLMRSVYGGMVELVEFMPAHTKWFDHVVLMNAELQAEGKIDFPANWQATEFSWSPNGRYLAFAVRSSGRIGLFLWDDKVGEGHLIPVEGVNLFFRGDSVFGPLGTSNRPYAWSRDSEHIVFAKSLSASVRVGNLDVVTEAMQPKLHHGRNGSGEGVNPLLSEMMFSSMLMAYSTTARTTRTLQPKRGLFTNVVFDENGKLIVSEIIRTGKIYKTELYSLDISSDTAADFSDQRGEVPYGKIIDPKISVVDDSLLVSGRRSFFSEEQLHLVDLRSDPTVSNKRQCVASGVVGSWHFSDGVVVKMMDGTFALMLHDPSARGWDCKEIRVPGTYVPVGLARLSQGHQYPSLFFVNRLEGSGESVGFYRYDIDSGQLSEHWSATRFDRAALVGVSSQLTAHFVVENTNERAGLAAIDILSGEVSVLKVIDPISMELGDFASRLISYSRADGVEMAAELFLPPTDIAPSKKMPTVIWQYPTSHKTVEDWEKAISSGRVREFETEFNKDYIGVWLPIALLKSGFAILYYPSFPLIGGDSEMMPYVDQMVMNAEAAVNVLSEFEDIDQDRLYIAGHSRGGGDALSILGRTDVFAGGLSFAGKMNATNDPYSMQYEERSFWEAPEAFIRNSPLLNAHRIDEPVFLVHGLEDGTVATPEESRSMFRALARQNVHTEMVLYPFENHMLSAVETKEDLVPRVVNWLDSISLMSQSRRPSMASGSRTSSR